MSQLKTLLFVEHSFNRTGKKGRFNPLFSVTTDAGVKYDLWTHEGDPDMSYPRNDEDKYQIFAEMNGMVFPIGYTLCRLKERCGHDDALRQIYGADLDVDDLKAVSAARQTLHENSGTSYTEIYNREEKTALALGSDQNRQAAFIHNIVKNHESYFLKCVESCGEYSYPDFVGALSLGRLHECVKLSEARIKRFEEEEQERRRKAEEEETRLIAEQAAEDEQNANNVISAFKNGGKVTNGKHFVLAADKLGVKIPLRTRGWIMNTFAECTIKDGTITGVRYYKRGNGKGSTKIFDIAGAMLNAAANA